jgi:hypothetical protein
MVDAFEASGLRRRILPKACRSSGDAAFLAEEAAAETGRGRKPSGEGAQSACRGRGGGQRQTCGGGISNRRRDIETSMDATEVISFLARKHISLGRSVGCQLCKVKDRNVNSG